MSAEKRYWIASNILFPAFRGIYQRQLDDEKQRIILGVDCFMIVSQDGKSRHMKRKFVFLTYKLPYCTNYINTRKSDFFLNAIAVCYV